MPRSSNYTYDPATGKWEKASSDNSNSTSNSTTKSKTSSKTSSGKSNLTSSTPNKDDSKGSTEKEYNEIEINTLSGTLNFICTNTTIKLQAGDTVKIKGIGSHLSGNYYVKDITRTISSSGYSHSATLIRTDFGNSLKVSSSNTASKTKKSKPKPVKKVASTPAPQKSPQRKYTVKKGDCLWKIAKQYYGNGAKYHKIASANGISAPYIIYTGQVLTIP